MLIDIVPRFDGESGAVLVACELHFGTAAAALQMRVPQLVPEEEGPAVGRVAGQGVRVDEDGCLLASAGHGGTTRGSLCVDRDVHLGLVGRVCDEPVSDRAQLLQVGLRRQC